jgi:hypothetical protein
MQIKDLYGDAKKAWMTTFMFKELLSFLKKFVPSEIS